ncbi:MULTISPECIES: hypothetical protein [Spirulina sp. CCY15215]|uniref:hypothetical protein n=1 Tax=Spirulina sp. CCY15215 TaxID=2767591 RepID=UPI00194F29FE|nr:hypothetical protein [Spirulina major]
MKSLLVKGLSLALLTVAIAPTALAAVVETPHKVTAKETQTELIKHREKREWYDRDSNRFQAENDILKSHQHHQHRRPKRKQDDGKLHSFQGENDTLKYLEKRE